MNGIHFDISLPGEKIDHPLLDPLFSDMVECERLLKAADSDQVDFARRIFVRSAFSFLEGHLYWFKGNVTKMITAKGAVAGTINVSHLLLLGDSAFKPGRTGKMESDDSRVPFLNYCAFILRCSAEAMDINADEFFSDNGWLCLQKSVKVRDRLTHPKRAEEMQVSTEEIATLRNSLLWFMNRLVDILNGAAESSVFNPSRQVIDGGKWWKDPADVGGNAREK